MKIQNSIIKKQFLTTYSAITLMLTLLLGSPLIIPSATVLAQAGEGLSPAQVQRLTELRYHLLTLDDLQNRGVLPAEEAHLEREHYLTQVEAITGQRLDTAQLTTLLEGYKNAQSTEDESTFERISGFFTFVNSMWALSSLLMVMAIGWLVHIYLWPILKEVPIIVYEALLYLLCLSSIVGGLAFSQQIGQFIALPGSIGLVLTLFLSHNIRLAFFEAFYERYKINPLMLNSFILFLAWTGIAIVYHSLWIAFIAIMALEVLLSFSPIVTPLSKLLGFYHERDFFAPILAAFLLLLLYVSVEIGQLSIPYFDLFSDALFFIGVFVYFDGLLAFSFSNKRTQVIAFISGIVTLFIGSLWPETELQESGGTFLFLFMVVKYIEFFFIKRNKKWWAWAALGLALILYGAALVITQYPDYFLFI